MHIAAPAIDLPERTPLVLGEHHSEAVSCVLGAWVDADRALVVMACGTGKTIVGHSSVVEAVKSSGTARVGIFVPSLGLVKQTIQMWRKFQPWGKRFRVVAVCSDPGVEADDIPLGEIPAVVTTDAAELVKFLAAAPSDAVNVIFATYHSSWVVAEALAEAGMQLDIGIADEAHNTAGSADKSFGLMLRDEVLPIRKRLFMTATPRITRRSDGEAVSMDNAAIYGKVVYNLSFREAVGRGIICDWEVLISVVTRDDVAANGLDRAVHGLSGERLQEAAGRAAIAKAIESSGVRKAISFHSTIRAARDFANAELSTKRVLPAFNVYHVNGADKSGRHQSMASFVADEKALVTNARCLTEGVDIPAVDLVAFLGRKSSKIDIVQAIGRALRKAPGKTKGYILLPVLFDPREGQSAEEAIADSNLATVWDVLAALRDTDEVFAEDVTRAGMSFGGPEGGSLLSSDWVRVVGDVNLHAIRNGLEVIALDALLFPFDHSFRRLVEFAEREGHAAVPKTHVETDGFRLGSWVFRRRHDYRMGRLSSERIARLEAVPGWVWSVYSDAWERWLAALRRFVLREGHAIVPAAHVEPDGIRLGSWVSCRRHDYWACRLSPDEIAELEVVPGWVWSARSNTWDRGLAALRRFVLRESHAKVPYTQVEPDGFNLGTWIGTRRAKYWQGKLSPDRISQLEALAGWVWDAQEEIWLQGLDALRGFVQREGHAKVPSDHVSMDGFKLGSWVITRRHDYRCGNLPQNRISELEALAGWAWDGREAIWLQGFDALRGFVQHEGHAKVPWDHVGTDGFKLGSWVLARRQDYRCGTLPSNRISELEALPGWLWDTRDVFWEQGLDALRGFVLREGHARVPRAHAGLDGFKLGRWVQTCRQFHRVGKLSPNRVADLEAVSGWVWDTRSTSASLDT